MTPLAALAAALALGAADRPVWTEADALAAFRQASPAVAEARSAAAEARGDLSQAGLVPNPSLQLGASNVPLRTNPPPTGNGPGLENNLVTSLELDQPIELGGKRGRRIAAARGALDEATLGVDDAVRTAGFDVRRAFWHAVRARDRRALAEQVSGRMAKTVEIMRARFESQDISGLDLDKVELEAAKDENDLADARAEERAAVQDLLALVGPGAPAEVQVAGDLASPAAAL
ncbi:MAG TPA: TolC family protein, partial [Anaeromyxobacter sp.]